MRREASCTVALPVSLEQVYLDTVEANDGQREKMSVKDFVRTVIKDDSGRLIECAPMHELMLHHVEWCREHGLWCAVYAPWESGKTTVFMGYVLHELAERGPLGWKCKVVSSGDSTASKRLCAVKRYIEDDLDFRNLYPYIVPGEKWTDHELDIAKDVTTIDRTLEAHGLRSSDMGSRADMIWFDDLLDAKNTLSSQVIRDGTTTLYENSWLSRVKSRNDDGHDGFVLFTSNVWHSKDLSQQIKEKAGYAVLEIAVNQELTALDVTVYNADADYMPEFLKDVPVKWTGRMAQFNIPLWDRFNTAILLDKKTKLRQSTFDRGYRLIPLTGEDKQFPSYEQCLEYGTAIDDSLLATIKYRVLAVDLSSDKRPGTVLCGLGWDGTKIVRFYLRCGQWTSPQTATAIKAAYDEYGFDVIAVENNAYQDALCQWIRMMGRAGNEGYEFWGRVRGWFTGSNKIDEDIGLPHLEVQFQNRYWRFLIPHKAGAHGHSCKCDYCREHEEFTTYPHGSTDIVMATWIGSRFIKVGGKTGATVKSADEESSQGGHSRPGGQRQDRSQFRPEHRVTRRFFG